MCNKKLMPPPPPRGMIGPRVNFVSRVARKEFNQVVAEEGLFAGQHHIIMLLNKVGSATISQIAEELGTTSATASVSIKRLEKAGFVEKTQSENDGRIAKIQLTQKAIDSTAHIESKMEETEKALVNGLSNDEINMLSDLLDKITLNIIKSKEVSEND